MSQLLSYTSSKEERVNTEEQGDQYFPATAALPDGGYVVTWMSDEQDGSKTGVFAQRYAADGTKKGDEFQVNTTSEDFQFDPFVTSLSDGAFFITWVGDDENGTNVFAQRYDSAGNPNGGEFRVNTDQEGSQYNPFVKHLDNGSFIVGWDSVSQAESRLVAQNFSAEGLVIGDEVVFDLPAEVPYHNYGRGGTYATPSTFTVLENGEFVLTWRQNFFDVFLQRFDIDGSRKGDIVQVNPDRVHPEGEEFFNGNPSIQPLENGGFMVFWEVTDAQAGGISVISAQRYNSDGTPDGHVFDVVDAVQGVSALRIIPFDDGGFFVTWAEYGSLNALGQFYDGVGLPVGEVLHIPHALGDSNIRQNAVLEDGRIVVSYTKDGNFFGVGDGDGDGDGVFAQIFTPLSGDNIFYATSAVEHFDGQGGTDTVDYSASLTGVNLSLTNGWGSTGDAAGDIYDSIENIIGSDYNDRIKGDDKSNHLQGGAGRDILEGGYGVNVLDGGDGWDYADYRFSDVGISANLAAGHVDGHDPFALDDVFSDTLLNIEALIGSNHDDFVIGSDNADFIQGKSGSDLIFGEGGDDVLHGDAGNDLLDGGWGLDRLVGGSGDDNYVLSFFDGENDVFDGLIDQVEFNFAHQDSAGVEHSESDAIDISSILDGFLVDPLTQAITDFVEITYDASAGVGRLGVDQSGSGNFTHIADLNVSSSDAALVSALTDEDGLVANGNLIVL